MNIFALSTCAEQAARWYCDRHCIKQILELGQILCSAYHLQGIQAPYKLTHKNHPSTVWSRTSCLNYEWTIEHAKVLCDEYTCRYGRRHASQDVIEWCDKNSTSLVFELSNQTDFATAIAQDAKCRQVQGFNEKNSVEKYRLYYIFDKSHLHSWKRNKPEWIKDYQLTMPLSSNEIKPPNDSLLIGCTEDEETFHAHKPHNHLCVWKGRDFWHKDLSIQLRLDPDGSIFLSTQEGHVSTLRTATITIEQLYTLIRGITKN